MGVETRIVLAGERGCSVSIEVLADEGEEFLSCRVSIVVQGFTADYRASFDANGFQRFHRELAECYRTLNGTASFRTMEGMLELDVEMTRTGGAVVRGVARSHDPRVEFEFEFGSDQTILGPVCRELLELVGRTRR
jgi:hypothetical protein